MATGGPGAVSGRKVAKAAGVHNAQIQQMFGSVDELVSTAVRNERDRYVQLVFPTDGALPDPLALADFPSFWRAITQVVLDPGPIDLTRLADGGPVQLLGRRVGDHNPRLPESALVVVASAWAAAPLGALVFRRPLQRGLQIDDRSWPRCWQRLGRRLTDLAELAVMPEAAGSTGTGEPDHLQDDRPAPTGGRDRLVQAAEQLLDTRLETAVRGRQLADHAGVNYGLVSHYFGSKSAVFDEALSNLHQRFLADVLADSNPTGGSGAPWVFLRHRAFLRAWASRLLGDRPVPDFNLLGMERLLDSLSARAARQGVDGSTDVTGDAMTAVALQLGWTLLRPLPTAAAGDAGPDDPTGTNPRTVDPVTAQLSGVHRWLLTGGN